MWPRGPEHDATLAAVWPTRDPAGFEGLAHYATLATTSQNAQA